MQLSNELRELLIQRGAKLVGFGKLNNEICRSYPVGISVALPVPLNILRGIKDGPTLEYYTMYHEWNAHLDIIVRAGADFLIAQGHKSFAMTTPSTEFNALGMATLPHKTIATRAGLGWIGKNNLLTTPEYGSAIRISSILTHAPLDCASPIDCAACGACTLCVDSCPAASLKGTLWSPSVRRDDIVDVKACEKKQREIMKSRTGIETDLCGMCIYTCPHTQKYMNSGS